MEGAALSAPVGDCAATARRPPNPGSCRAGRLPERGNIAGQGPNCLLLRDRQLGRLLPNEPVIGFLQLALFVQRFLPPTFELPRHPSWGADRMRFPVRPRYLTCWLVASCCLAAVVHAADRPAWLVVGPWEAQIEASWSGMDSALRVVVPGLRVTLDLDQPPLLAGSSGGATGSAPDAGATSAPSIDLPPMVKSLRVDGGEFVVKRGGQTQVVNWHAEFSQVSAGVWQGIFAATGEGIALTASVTYEAERRTWRVSQLAAQLDLARWSALVLPGLLPENEAWTCAGSAHLDAAISWTPAGLDGTAEVSIHGGSASRFRLWGLRRRSVS